MTDAIEHIQIDIADYKPHPRNYNEHPDPQVGEIAESLRVFGQVKPVVVWREWYIAGHGVVLGAQRLGWTQLKAERLPADWPEYKALAYLAADNELARGASPNLVALAALAKEVQDQDAGLGRLAAGGEEGLRRLAALMAEPAGEDAGPQIDRAEELREKWGVEAGQMWQLGEHRVICGDCTDAGVVARVMGGEKAQACITDPPYGMNWSADASRFTGGKFGNHPRGRERDDVINDNKPFDPSPFLSFPIIALWGMNHYCDKLPPGGLLVWIKKPDNRFGTFLSDCEIAWTNVGHGVYAFRHEWGGITRESERGEFLHPTQKPVVLVEWVMEKIGASGVVYDPFLGSGTTLIACERLGRRCRAVEISPGYVAVTLQRWADYTGRQPVLLDA